MLALRGTVCHAPFSPPTFFPVKPRLILAVLLAGILAPAFAQTAAPKGAKAKAAPPAAKNPAMAPITDRPGLPRVLLIGDSISIGYTVAVRELLEGKANVHRIPENGGPTTRGLTNLAQWLGSGKWDVIHFNWGLHDLKFMPAGQPQVSLADYEKNLRAMVTQLKKTKAKLIWCATTPVPDGKLNPPRTDRDVRAYNAVAKKIMDENKIAINDLYAYTRPKLAEVQRPANVHFTDEGSRFLAKKVAASIEEALKR